MGRNIRKIMAITTVLALILGISGNYFGLQNVQAGTPGSQICLGWEALQATGIWTKGEGKMLYFGAYQQGDGGNTAPMPYRVLEADQTSAFIDCDTVIAHQFMAANSKDGWFGSSLDTYLNGTFYQDAFSETERKLIKKTNVTGGENYIRNVSGTDYTLDDGTGGAYIYSLSVREFETYYKSTAETNKGNAHHFLRSVTPSGVGQSTITSGGSLAISTDYYSNVYIRMSPCMNISLDQLAFTKDYYYENGEFAQVNATESTEFVLAVYDGNNEFQATMGNDSVVTEEKGGTLQLNVADASGTAYIYSQISAMLVEANTQNVLYYGKVQDIGETSAEITIPKGLDATKEYTLYVFEEQVKGKGETCTVSNMVSFELEVQELYDLSASQSTEELGYTYQEGEIPQTNVAELKPIALVADEDHFFSNDFIGEIACQKKDAQGGMMEISLEEAGISASLIDRKNVELSGTLNCSVNLVLPVASKNLEPQLSLKLSKTRMSFDDEAPVLEVTASLDDEIMQNELNTDELIFESSNPSVIEVNRITGALTIKKVGEARIKATLPKGDFYYEQTVTSEPIVISPRDLSLEASVKWVGESIYTEDGNEWKPEFLLTAGDKTLQEGVDYVLHWPEDMIHAGKKEIIVEFVGNYTGNIVVEGTIIKKDEPKPAFNMPDIPFTIKGEQGENNYYITPAVLLPAEGYEISFDKAKGYGESVSIEASTKNTVVYLKDNATGLTSEAIPVPELLVDINKPVVVGASAGQTLYGEEVTIGIKDLNIQEIKLNDEPVAAMGFLTTLNLSSAYGIEEYNLYAKDKAGNETQMKIVVAEEWMKTRIVPPAKTVHLRKDHAYYLGQGYWQVEGDQTVYTGGMTFYIDSEYNYQFTKK